MECPVCQKNVHIEIDMHADGYAENLQECGDCGTLWIRTRDAKQVVHRKNSLSQLLERLRPTSWSSQYLHQGE